MINFDDFINKTLGKSIDTDGFPKSQPYQCVDLAKYFNMLYNKGLNISCSTSGYAKDWSNNKKTNGLLKYFKETTIKKAIKGSLVVWGNCKVAPKSHIAFFVRDVDGTKGVFLSQNSPEHYTQLIQISYDGIIGVFIPNVLMSQKENSKSSIYITLGNMYVRYGAGTNYSVKLVKELTIDGKKNATSSNPYSYAVYKKGTKFTALELIKNKDGGLWARTPSGYVCIKGASGTVYCNPIKD